MTASRYRIVGKAGDFEFNEPVEGNLFRERLEFIAYEKDDGGNTCGVRFSADLGHGYGFDDGSEEFTLHPGESYHFTHWFTSCDGPTDWDDDYFAVDVTLIEEG